MDATISTTRTTRTLPFETPLESFAFEPASRARTSERMVSLASSLSSSARHEALAHYVAQRFSPRLSPTSRAARLDDCRDLELLEEQFLESERGQVTSWAAQAPTSPVEFGQWFSNLRFVGPGQSDPLFSWLAQDATLDEMRWFLGQEVAGEAGFEDLVALAQLKLPPRAKLELARNYWDELGRGTEGGMHGPMLARLATQMGLEEFDDVVWEAVALGNLMGGLGLDRGYAYHLIGALGVIELTAPDRAEAVNAGMSRLGIEGHARQYYALHATLDRKHWVAWRDDALLPLIEEDPRRALPLAEGALMRLTAGARCFTRYRAVLGVGR